MKETINNFHIISKGIVLSVILHMISIGFLVLTGFNSTLLLFTIILLVVMAVSGFYVGTISDRYAEINGLIIAIFTSTIVLLYIAQYTEMDWSVNRIIIASYLVIGFLSSLISRLTNKKQKSKNNLVVKEKYWQKSSKNVSIGLKIQKTFNHYSSTRRDSKINKADRKRENEELKRKRWEENRDTFK